MKTSRIIIGIVFAIYFANLPQLFAQIGPGPAGPDLDQIDRQITYFRGGDTNAPLLATAWSHGDRIVGQFFGVSLSGRCWISGNISGQTQLDSTNLELMVAAINALPQPPTVIPPKERQLVVCGTRTNQWFKYVYDRANVPIEVERLYEITGVSLEWFIPMVEFNQITNQDIQSLLIASDAPIGVGFSPRGIELMDLDKYQSHEIVPSNIMPYGGVRTISPDGSILVVAGAWGTCAIDLKTKQLLWNKPVLAQNGTMRANYGQHLAIGGNKGQFLFISTFPSHPLERWDMTTGKCLAVLTTNQPLLKTLEVSRNGKVLLAGFANTSFDNPKSFIVWKADEDKPATHVEETALTSSCISPDGKIIALNVFGSKVLELWNWKDGSMKEVPLRLPNGSVCALKTSWSSDGSKIAAYLQSYKYSMVIYETASWKPLARWMCDINFFGRDDAGFTFGTNGKLFQSCNVLDVNSLKSLGD